MYRAYPYAVSTFGDGGAQLFAVLFFMTLFLLGIDSAFSMVEAITTVISDSDFGIKHGLTRERISTFVCFSGMCGSAVFWYVFLFFLKSKLFCMCVCFWVCVCVCVCVEGGCVTDT